MALSLHIEWLHLGNHCSYLPPIPLILLCVSFFVPLSALRGWPPGSASSGLRLCFTGCIYPMRHQEGVEGRRGWLGYLFPALPGFHTACSLAMAATLCSYCSCWRPSSLPRPLPHTSTSQPCSSWMFPCQFMYILPPFQNIFLENENLVCPVCCCTSSV